MYSSRLLAITTALFISIIVAPGYLSAEELSPAVLTEPSTASPFDETWLTGVSVSLANRTNSPLAALDSAAPIPPLRFRRDGKQ